jgi:hypothetical protein
MGCLGFDSEIAERIYLKFHFNWRDSISSLLRVIDISWDVVESYTVDGTVAVTDFNEVLLTPLGYELVPPPMSAYSAALPAPATSLTFWGNNSNNPRTAHNLKCWGLACLCHDLLLRIIYGDSDGKPQLYFDVDLRNLLTSGNDNEFFAKSRNGSLFRFLEDGDIIFRKVVVTEESDEGHVHVVLLGLEIKGNRSCDVVVDLKLDVVTGKVNYWNRYSTFLDINSGPVTVIVTLAPWPQDTTSVAVGISTPSGFVVQRLQFDDKTMASSKVIIVCNDDLAFHFPEVCNQLHIFCDDSRTAVVGLSKRKRLYCGEVLLRAGVSSMCVNKKLRVLLFISMGSHPHLHFVSIDGLLKLEQISGQLIEESDKIVIEFAETRPLERGSRLLINVKGDAKVVVQLPRGNLEAFEPRPLVIVRAQRLLLDSSYYECLILLRRQRVDLNYIVDFNPRLFAQNLRTFVKFCVRSKPELLCQFITSLEPGNNTLNKFKLGLNPSIEELMEDSFESSAVTPRHLKNFKLSDAGSENKVNVVCSALRDELLQLLEDAESNPVECVLCTYAVQKPPLLHDALKFTSNLPMKSQFSAIRYLFFLVEGSQLFNAALEMTDFAMAQTIAGLSQMDPKAFVPLIENFKVIGEYRPASLTDDMNVDIKRKYREYRVKLMQFEIFLHLNNLERSVEHAALFFRSFCSLAECIHKMEDDAFNGLIEDCAFSIQSVCERLLAFAKKESNYILIIRYIQDVVSTQREFCNFLGYDSIASKCISQICDLLRQCYYEHGTTLRKDQKFEEAVVLYMSAHPPYLLEAMEASQLSGNWNQSLLLASKIDSINSIDKNSKYYLKKTASEIVTSFRVSLEQGSNNLHDNSGTVGLSNFHKDTEVAADCILQSERAEFAAGIAMGYLNDVESAVAIASLARRWTYSLRIALGACRLDLYDEVYHYLILHISN